MDTLRDRMTELAADAPTGGVPAAELWARGKRAHRLRTAAVGATVLAVVVGTGVGVRLAYGNDTRFDPALAGTVDISLPVEYPPEENLPDLGDAPGALAAIWVDPSGGGAPAVVGLVAETGTFGTLPIDVPEDDLEAPPGWRVPLSPDGRRIAYRTTSHEVVVHDLMSGEKVFPTIDDKTLAAYDWLDATHLYGTAGSRSGTRDTDGWAWEPGTAAKLVDLSTYPGQPYLGYGWPYAGEELMVVTQTARSCGSPPRLLEASADEPNRTTFEVPMLCDVLGVVGPGTLLGHWDPRHFAGDPNDPKYPEGTVVALDIRGADRPYLEPALRGPGSDRAFEDRSRRHVVVTAGAPHRVTFATDLIEQALAADAGAS